MTTQIITLPQLFWEFPIAKLKAIIAYDQTSPKMYDTMQIDHYWLRLLKIIHGPHIQLLTYIFVCHCDMEEVVNDGQLDFGKQ